MGVGRPGQLAPAQVEGDRTREMTPSGSSGAEIDVTVCHASGFRIPRAIRGRLQLASSALSAWPRKLPWVQGTVAAPGRVPRRRQKLGVLPSESRPRRIPVSALSAVTKHRRTTSNDVCGLSGTSRARVRNSSIRVLRVGADGISQAETPQAAGPGGSSCAMSESFPAIAICNCLNCSERASLSHSGRRGIGHRIAQGAPDLLGRHDPQQAAVGVHGRECAEAA